MKQKLNLDTWNRKEHFLFFKQMEEPFFGMTTRIDCTKAYEKAKQLDVSFFTYYLHKTLVAVNRLEPFRYRIINDEVYIFDQIDVSATILREDKTFGFSLMEYDENLTVFDEITKKEIERIQNTTGLITRDFEINLIQFNPLVSTPLSAPAAKALHYALCCYLCLLAVHHIVSSAALTFLQCWFAREEGEEELIIL